MVCRGTNRNALKQIGKQFAEFKCSSVLNKLNQAILIREMGYLFFSSSFSSSSSYLVWHVGSSSLTRDQTRFLALGVRNLSHWTTREVLKEMR